MTPDHQRKPMRKLIRLALMMLLCAQVITAPRQSAADPEREKVVQEQERAFFERATTLHRSIQKGWGPGAVTSIMGPPNAVGRTNDGRDEVETWWYHDYEVGIEFRNGAISQWFFRFILR
jgi:hypothetical protein